MSKFKRLFLYKIKNVDLLKEFKIIHDELNNIREKRNKFLHSIWFVDDNNKIMRFKYRSDIKVNPDIFDEEQNSLKNIDDVLNRIIQAKETLSELDKKVIEYYNSLLIETPYAKEQRKNQEKTST